MSERPTSPHLGIYRWQISNTLSILHRMTGVALSVGLLLFVTWIAVAAYMPSKYEILHSYLASPVGLFLLFGWTFSFYYHLANGIRHLLWDTGAGFKLPQVNTSGWLVVFFTVLMTGLTWGLVMHQGGAGL